MEPEGKGKETDITASGTQTSRPCTPIDVLVTRPYVEQEPFQLPPLVPSVKVSIITPVPPAENSTNVNENLTTEQSFPVNQTATVKGIEFKPNNLRRSVNIPSTVSLETRGNAFTRSAKVRLSEDPQVPRELNTTPVSLVSKSSTHSQISTHSLAGQTQTLRMNAGESAPGTTLPVANVKRDTMLVRNARNKHTIADLNALRNKFINYDQYRLNKRKTDTGKSVHFENNGKPQLAIGDFDFERPQPRHTTALVRRQETETRSGPRFSSNEPKLKDLTLARSKTYAGPDDNSASHFTREGNKDGLICDIKGLHKEPSPLNHNSPHAELLSPRDVDRIKMSNLNKYFNASSPDPTNIAGIAMGNGVTTEAIHKPVKPPGRNFRSKRENSRLVLKFYSDGKSKTRDTLQLSHDASLYNYTSKHAAQPENAKLRSSKVAEVDSDTANTGLASGEQPGVRHDRPVSLTSKNLEIFDHLTSTNEKVKCDKISEESDSETNARVLDWLVQGKLLTQHQPNPTFKTPVNKQVIPVAP